MSEKCISSVHIEKLGHKIQEIRERALHNIISKLDHGFVYDNDLARSKEILTKLFNWFLLEPCTKEDVVLSLIKRILKTESGFTLIKHYGANTIKSQLKGIQYQIDEKYNPLIKEILEYIDSNVGINEVPPLVSEIPLSFRSYTNNIGSTATSICGQVYQEASREQRSGPSILNADYVDSEPFKCIPNYILPWHPLISSDRHVLNSVEDSLRNPPQPAALLHSCNFFIDVMLHDFPAEIFLQRPGIVSVIQRLVVTHDSIRIKTAALNCLINLTNSLRTRINYHCDPSTHNLKEPQVNSNLKSMYIDSYRTEVSNCSLQTENYEDAALLKTKQLSLPQFCINTFNCIFNFLSVKYENLNESKRKKSQVALNSCLLLLDLNLSLLSLCVNEDVWNYKTNSTISDFIFKFTDVIGKLGEILEFYRLEVLSNDCDRTLRCTHLHLLYSCVNLLSYFIPLSKSDFVLPRNFKSALANVVLDCSFAKLYPNAHGILVNYTQNFVGNYHNDSLKKYNDIKDICSSITSAIRFIKSGRSLPVAESIRLAKEGLLSLEFHRHTAFIKVFIEICTNTLPMTTIPPDIQSSLDYIILSLLAYNDLNVRENFYHLCHKRVIAAIGPKLNTTKTSVPGSQILYLLRSEVIIEISTFGTTSENKKIAKYSEDILIHLLKCKILVSENVWNSVVEAIIPSIPMLLCHAGKNDTLGRTLLSILDPDKASDLYVASIEVLKGNACLLFTDDILARTEATSRLCWLLASQYDSKNLLPKISNLQDKAVTSVCILKRTSDLNKTRGQQHFYPPSALIQVLELLNTNNVEPVIRRSAITQVSVMMEDPLLHLTFVENGGIKTILSILRSALTENSYRDYPDSVVPAICVLKNICLHCPSMRQELSNDIEVLYFVIRSLFMYCTEGRMKQDGSTLLFLLLYTTFIHGAPSKGDLSLPHIVFDKLYVPFTCNVHWKCSKYFIPSLAAVILTDKWCKTSIQIHWNSEWYGGFQELLNWSDVNYAEEEFDDKLKLNSNILLALRNSSIEMNVKSTLVEVQNGTNHTNIHNAINKLIMFLNVIDKINSIETREVNVLSYEWESTFTRFLITPSASSEDTLLLINVLKCLSVLIKFYKLNEGPCWITSFLILPSHYLNDLLQIDHSKEEEKLLHQELLSLITSCVYQEQNYLDFFVSNREKDGHVLWIHVISALTETLQFNDAHFYNLAYLDCTLRCLVQLTSSLGWSSGKSETSAKTFVKQLVIELCKLVAAFHCGKGQSATSSYMGLSITRNVMLILNHVLAEMQLANVKNEILETCYLEKNIAEENIISLWTLWNSRDVILRASVIQLFTGLSLTIKGTNVLFEEIANEDKGILDCCLEVVLDHEEASIVREKATNLLTNLLSNLNVVKSKPAPFTKNCETNDVSKKITKLLDECSFYKELEVILLNLYTKSKFYLDNVKGKQLDCSMPSDDSIASYNKTASLYDNVINTDRSNTAVDPSNDGKMITTPSFIKAICNLLYNLILISPEVVTSNLNDNGLLKMFFKIISDICVEIRNTKDLMLYSDLLQMNAGIYFLLEKAITHNSNCLTSILHSKDCLHTMITLLNPNLYYITLPQLMYLRNKLWSEIFSLISILLDGNDCNGSTRYEAITTINSLLQECGYKSFLQTLCEAIDSNNGTELQVAALNSLTSLLRWETSTIYDTQPVTNASESSMQTLFDNYETPRLSQKSSSSSLKSDGNFTMRKEKMNLLENIYFADTKSNVSTKRDNVQEAKPLMAGADICKMLMELYDIVHLKSEIKTNAKRKCLIINTLTSVLCVSREAKTYANENGLLDIIIKQLKGIHIKLSLETPDCMRRVSGKKKLCPLLKDLNNLVGLLTNFLLGDKAIKNAAAAVGISDIIHKLWIWFLNQRNMLIIVLKFLCTFTTNCPAASQSLTFTSSVAGAGPRKVPSNVSLLHAIFTLIAKEMDQVSRTHDLIILELVFHLLENSCNVVECRMVICKSNLLQHLSRLHPAITKRQKPWDNVELLWLSFLEKFTSHPEGQGFVAKFPDALELIITLTNSTRSINRQTAMYVLRNVSFYPSNRSRLLTSDEFLNVLQLKIANGTYEEINLVVLMIWALIANNQKSKLIIKSVGLDVKLQDTLKLLNLSKNEEVNETDLDRMRYILNLLREGEKI